MCALITIYQRDDTCGVRGKRPHTFFNRRVNTELSLFIKLGFRWFSLRCILDYIFMSIFSHVKVIIIQMLQLTNFTCEICFIYHYFNMHYNYIAGI